MVARTFQKRASRPRASAWLAARDFEVEAMTLRNSFQALRRRLAPTEPETATDPVPEAYPGQHEQRLSLRLLSYWQHLRGDATFASRARIETEVIAEMWPWCFILEVPAIGNPAAARYAYVGPAIAERSLVTTDIRDPAALRAAQRTISAVLGAANCKEKTS